MPVWIEAGKDGKLWPFLAKLMENGFKRTPGTLGLLHEVRVYIVENIDEAQFLKQKWVKYELTIVRVSISSRW